MTRSDEPLDLGATAEPPGEPSGDGLRRWVVPAAAALGGVLLGLLVADIRDDTADYADVRLVSGMIQASSAHADETAPGSVELSLLNYGEHEVEILGLEPAGMTVQPDEDPGEPVAAPPGEWVTVQQTGLIADCSLTEPSGGLRVRVRDGGGAERVVEAGGLPDLAGVDGAWWSACEGQGLTFTQNDALAATHDGGSVTLDVLLSNGGRAALTVHRFQSETPGLVATGPGVPFEVPAGEVLRVPLTWTVTDCALARQWPEVRLYFEAGEDVPASSGYHHLAGRPLAELIVMVQRVCGDRG